MSYRIINGNICSLEPLSGGQNTQTLKNTSKKLSNTNKISEFQSVLNNVVTKKDDITISKHAALRLNDVNFTDEDMTRIKRGFEIAKEKNSKNAVMIYKDTALIASIENKTIITAVNKDRAKDNVFTNIDSVVIL